MPERSTDVVTMPEVEAAFEEIEVDAPLVGIIMGSKNDKPKMQPAGKALQEAGIRYEVRVMSAHRDPEVVRDYCMNAQDAGAEGDHRRSGDVGGPAGRRRRAHRPAGDRRAHPRQEPRRASTRCSPPCRCRPASPSPASRSTAPRTPAFWRRGIINTVISRYTREEIGAVWTDERRMSGWLEVELAATDAWAAEGVVPAEAAAACRERAAFTVDAVKERERTTGHDVAAFVDVVAASIGDDGRWIHYGLTSSDVLDTALALQLREAGRDRRRRRARPSATRSSTAPWLSATRSASGARTESTPSRPRSACASQASRSKPTATFAG